MSHVLVIANETAASHALLDALRHKDTTEDRFTVIAPVNEPARGYVVYEDTRRASAGRRLEKTLKALREAGFAAQGFVVETGPVQAAKDALAQLEPPVDEIVVSTHPAERSGCSGRRGSEPTALSSTARLSRPRRTRSRSSSRGRTRSSSRRIPRSARGGFAGT